MRRLLLTVVVAGCLSAGGWAQAVGAAPMSNPPPGKPPIDQADILGTELFAASSSTGMVMVVVRGKEVFFRGYGEAVPGTGFKPDQLSMIRICSLTKIFTTDLLAKMVAEGTVKLSDPLEMYAPEGALVPAKGGRDITLEDLATHTAGLAREVAQAPKGAAHFTFPDYAYRWRWLPKQVLKTVPGQDAVYSNVGFDLLGDALQAAGHEPYAQLLAEKTTTPLGMNETGFTPTINQCSRLMRGAHAQGPCTDTLQSAGSAGIYSTAADMTKWLQYLLGVGPAKQMPSAEAVYVDPRSLHSEQGLDHAGTPSGIGLGWMHLDDDASPSSVIEKTGGGAGFVTYIALNQFTHTGVFLAWTDGTTSNGFNVFKASNDLLLTMAGVPLLAREPEKVVVAEPIKKPVAGRPAAKPGGKKAAAAAKKTPGRKKISR